MVSIPFIRMQKIVRWGDNWARKREPGYTGQTNQVFPFAFSFAWSFVDSFPSFTSSLVYRWTNK